MEGLSSPSLTLTDNISLFLLHQFGMRHKIPVCSIFSTSFKNEYASVAVNFKGWNISPFSINSAINGETSAARFRLERRIRSFSLSSLYSVNAYCNGICCTLPSGFLDAYVARNANGMSSPLFSTR